MSSQTSMSAILLQQKRMMLQISTMIFLPRLIQHLSRSTMILSTSKICKSTALCKDYTKVC